MKKGSFLSGKNLGTEPAPTAADIRALNRQIIGNPETGETPPEPPAPLPPPAFSAPAEIPPSAETQTAPPEKEKERKVRITIDIPESLHESLKIYTFRNKTTMKDLFLDYVAGLVAHSK